MSERYRMYQILKSEMQSILLFSFTAMTMGALAGVAWMLPGLPDGASVRLLVSTGAIFSWILVYLTIRRVERETTFDDEDSPNV